MKKDLKLKKTKIAKAIEHLVSNCQQTPLSINSLESRTLCDKQIKSQSRITVRDYGNGVAEVGWAFIGSVPTNKAERGHSTQKSRNEERAARRAKSRLRQLILSANLTHLLTLTYRENVTDFERATKDLNRFLRKVKLHNPNWKYVAVAEKQERGAYHWHLAVQGHQDVDFLRKTWLAIVVEGNIDVSAPRSIRKDQRLFLVQYMSKFLFKQIIAGGRKLNQRHFRSSRNIAVPKKSFTLSKKTSAHVREVALRKLQDSTGKNAGFVWDAEDLLAGWACSWE